VQRRFRFTLEPPPGSHEPARSFTTLPLEPIELRSVLFAATRMLTRQAGWQLIVEHVTEGDPE
jgi:hypothetical protein